MKTVTTLALTLVGLPALAADPISTSWRNDIAASGWDVVSFFQGDPQRGDDEFAHTFMGAEWRFASEANRDLFAINPQPFLPQYGGYCAWAVAHDKLARGNPEHWALLDGKLYFNFNDRTHRLWDEDRGVWIAKADVNWPTVLD